MCVFCIGVFSPMNNLTFPFHSFFDNHPCAQSHEACVKEGPWSARPHPAASAAHVVELLVGVVVLQLLCRDQRGRELVFSVWEVQLIWVCARVCTMGRSFNWNAHPCSLHIVCWPVWGEHGMQCQTSSHTICHGGTPISFATTHICNMYLIWILHKKLTVDQPNN